MDLRGQKMEEIGVNERSRVKEHSGRLVFFTLRTLVGLFLGLILSLIAREIFDLGKFTFVFVIVVIAMLVLRLSSKWGYKGLAIFCGFCFLTGLLLKSYIQHAPGL